MAMIPAAQLRAQILAILRAWGMPEELAQTTAEVMTETDLMGVDSHGISMLVSYERMRAAGQVKLDARPRVVRDGGVTALVDGGAGLGHPVAAMAMRLAMEKARAHGVGVVGVFNSHHFGAAGWYARLAAAEGLVGLVMSSARSLMLVPTGGALPMLGTNPIAFAAPARRNRPFVLDMATTTVAANKVKVHELNAKPVPAGWVVDGAGRPVTDPAAAMEQLFRRPDGGLTPLGGDAVTGGHKGYGLAMMAQILGATLTGGSFSPLREARKARADEPDNIGHFMLALDPAAFRPPGAFEDDLDEAVDALHAMPPADPARPVLVAGEPEEMERERRLAQGIPMPQTLLRQVREIAGRAGAEALF